MAAAAALTLAAPGHADEALSRSPPLTPLLELQRPTPRTSEAGQEPHLRGCAQPPLEPRAVLPFGPGELLSYEVAVLGVPTAKVHLKVGDPIVVDGLDTLPLQAQARGETFLGLFGEIDARMVSFFEPRGRLPIRMVNRTSARRAFQAESATSREDSAFAPASLGPTGPRGGEVNARLHREGPGGPSLLGAQLKSGADIVDLLSLFYYLRARDLREGDALCMDLYHRRRLWRVEGKVTGAEVVRVPAGARRARRLDVRILRGESVAPRPLSIWLSEDEHHVPVRVASPEQLGEVELRLVSHKAGLPARPHAPRREAAPTFERVFDLR